MLRGLQSRLFPLQRPTVASTVVIAVPPELNYPKVPNSAQAPRHNIKTLQSFSPPFVHMPRWSIHPGGNAKIHNVKATEQYTSHDSVHVVDPEEIEIEGSPMTMEYALFNSLSSQTSEAGSLYSRPASIAASTLSRLSRLRGHIFKSSRAPSPRNSVLDDDSAPSFYSVASSARESTGSTSTIATVTAPSFPPTPPSGPSESLVFHSPCTIPFTEIHNHTGTFYYGPPTPAPPRPTMLRTALLPASSSKLKTTSPRSTCEPHEQTVTTAGGPAIFIIPPGDAPAEVYLPSISPNMLRHSKSSITPPSSSISLLSPTTTSYTSVDSGTKISGRSAKFLRRVKAVLTEGSLGSIRNVSVGTGTRRRISGLTIPPLLDSSILDHDRLSVSWLDREARVALAIKEESARKAREEAVRRALEMTMNRYRAPIVGF